MIEAKKMLKKIALLREGAEKRGFRIIKAEGRGIIVRGSSFTDEDLAFLEKMVKSKIEFSVVPVKEVVPEVEILLILSI